MKSISTYLRASLLGSFILVLLLPFTGRSDERFIGIWTFDEGIQVTELTFRSDGRYQKDTWSTDPVLDFHFAEGGRYDVSGTSVILRPYEYLGDPMERPYDFEFNGTTLSLTRTEFSLTETYQFNPGSRQRVQAAETVAKDPIGRWTLSDDSGGTDEFLFRPGGYYVFTRTPAGGPFPPDVRRGRYSIDGSQLVLRPYSGVEAAYELDYYGDFLTLVRQEELSGDATRYSKMAGSGADVRTKAAEADLFLAQAQWQVGVWEIRDPFLSVDLTLRPDGHYSAVNSTEFLNGIVRGRYSLESRRIRLDPFAGQDPYARSNGEFGKASQTRELDYYDGELQFINLGALSQSVYIARKKSGSDVAVLDKSRQAQAIRNTEGWHLGRWEVNDPLGWMELTLRPDGRYLFMAGANRVPGQVERGQYSLNASKLTLAPYTGLGNARGFEIDLYDGDLFVAGDFSRMVIARKIPGSDAEVIEKTVDPQSLKGELGILLGRWTSYLPGLSTDLVFRDDGQFRLDRCSQTMSRDFGLYQVNLASRTLVLDSRYSPVRTAELDFYGDTLTIHGGLGPTATYSVHLGEAHEAIAASFAADDAREGVDALWLNRVTVGPRDLTSVQIPVGDIPPDPLPGRLFQDPTVLTQYRLYRRLIPGFVYFNVSGVIKAVAVVNTREWHFFPTGRVLVRFKNYFAGPFYPGTTVQVDDSWGAYRIGPKPGGTDVLHLYADNSVALAMDSGDEAELTLEDGRRHLFWDKDYQILSDWAAEQKPISCESSDDIDLRLMNTGIPLSSSMEPDPVGNPTPVLIGMTMSASGEVSLKGSIDLAGPVAVDVTGHLSSPIQWQPVQTNTVPAGAFNLTIAPRSDASGFYRLRRP